MLETRAQWHWHALTPPLATGNSTDLNFLTLQSRRESHISSRSFNFISQAADNKYLRFSVPYSLCLNYSILQMQHKSGHRQKVDEWVLLNSSKILFINTGHGPYAPAMEDGALRASACDFWTSDVRLSCTTQCRCGNVSRGRGKAKSTSTWPMKCKTSPMEWKLDWN